MESITEMKLLNKVLNFQKKEDVNDSSSSFHKSRNNKKIASSLFISSSRNNNLANNNLILHNDSSPKFSIHSSFQKNNDTNIKLNINKKIDNYITDDINIKRIKKELNKKDTIRPFMKSKFLTTKLKIVKKDNTNNKTITKKSLITPPFQENDKQIKSPKTIFQKILVNLDKLKKRTNKAIEVMKRNLQVTNEEIKMRREQERQIQILSATTYMQNLGYKKYKKKKNSSFSNNNNSNNPYRTLYITKYKNKNNNKSMSNILPNISTNNNSNTYNNNYNQSISNGSTTLINFINETNNINLNSNNNLSSSLNINPDQKTFTKKNFSSSTKNNANNTTKNKNDLDLDSTERKRLKYIPEMNLSSIESTEDIKSLFPVEKHNRVYKNMFHYRNLNFSLLVIRKQLYKVYGMPALLVEQSEFKDENDMNSLLLNNKIRIVQDNIDHFKINIMYKNDFFEAFNNMENYQKAEFNYNMEEISCVLIKIIPILLQNYYDIIKKLISIVIPNIKQERLKKPESENQCLNLNYSFFNSATELFKICIEVYRVLSTKENRFIYSLTDFGPLNSYLDIVRYCSNNIISMSNAHINKTKGDKKILEKLEVGLNIKKEEKKVIDFLERYHLRHRQHESEIDLKIDRVKRALNMKIDKIDYNKKRPWKKITIKKNTSLPQKDSAFNSSLFRNMLKYFKPEIRSRIIALQVADRFEKKKHEKIFEDEDDDIEGGNAKKKIIS